MTFETLQKEFINYKYRNKYMHCGNNTKYSSTMTSCTNRSTVHKENTSNNKGGTDMTLPVVLILFSLRYDMSYKDTCLDCL